MNVNKYISAKGQTYMTAFFSHKNLSKSINYNAILHFYMVRPYVFAYI